MRGWPDLRVAAAAVAVAALSGGVGPALAAGGRLTPVQESYLPGEMATLVGYTGGPGPPPVPTTPLYAYLRPAAETRAFRVLDSDIRLGRIEVGETGHRGFLHVRVSVTFAVPEALALGGYIVWYCDDPCTGATLGDLGPGPLSIGEEPARPVARQWAFDEPEIANLAPGALVVGADFQTTAADVRAGRVAAPPEPPPSPVAPPSRALPPVRREDRPDWTRSTGLIAAAAAGTWLVLSRKERSWVREAATRRPGASAGGRRAGAGRV